MERTVGLAVVLACAVSVLPACGSAGSGDGSEDPAVSEEQVVSSCDPTSRAEVLLWTEDAWLLDVAKRLTPDAACRDWWVAVPLEASDKTQFHPNAAAEIAQVHALGNNFHALAEFNWGAWRAWIDASPGTRSWYKAGVEFRARMLDAGFTTFSGNSDTWLVQELPLSIVAGEGGVDPHVVRTNAIDAARGLYEGGLVRKLGGTTRAGVTSHVTDAYVLDAERRNAEAFLEDGAFWSGISRYVRWWGEEVYVEPRDVCTASADVAQRARAIDDFVFRLPRLADANPGATTAARALFTRAFTPWLNGAWGTDGGYGDVAVSATEMQMFVSTQVYAMRAWGASHAEPGGRMAWSWSPKQGQPQAQLDALAQRLASSIDDAYAPGAAASKACSASGAFTFCQCAVDGARILDGWQNVFGTW